MKRRALLVLIGSLALGCSSSPSTSPAPPAPPAPASGTQEAAAAIEKAVEIEIPPRVSVEGEPTFTTLDALMKEHRIPGVSIAVFENYELVWSKTYGTADASTNQPVTAATLFQAASISKPVNGLATLLLEEQGKLSIDAPVNDSLTTWKLPASEHSKGTPVTFLHLLTHTAGTTISGFPGYPSGTAIASILDVLNGKPPANTGAVLIDKKPGLSFRYSGGGISVVQLALMDITKKAYPELLQSLVLAPMAMTSSTFEQPLPATRVSEAAAGHLRNGEVLATKRHVYPEMAAAGLWTTPTDLGKLFIAIAKARDGLESPISQAVATKLTSPATKSDDPNRAVGISMFLNKHQDTWMFGHGGGNAGFSCNAIATFKGGNGLVIMTNSDSGGHLFAPLERALFGRPGWPGLEPAVVRVALAADERQRFEGRYVVGPRAFVVTTDVKNGGALELRQAFGKGAELVPVGNGVVVSREDGLRLSLGENGLLVDYNGARPNEAIARVNVDAKVPILELNAGRFDEAVQAWKALERANPRSPALSEDYLNRLGYDLIGRGQKDDALTVLRFVTQVRPRSSNAFDSLGEIHMLRGEKDLAIQAYELSLEKLGKDPTIPAADRAARRVHGEAQLKQLRAL